MKSKQLVLLCIIFSCFIGCKNSPKQVHAGKDITPTPPNNEVSIQEKKEDEKTEINIESATEKNKAVNIPKKKVLKVVPPKKIEKSPVKETVPSPTIQQQDNLKIDARLKFKLEDVSTDELNSKICGLFETIEEKIIEGDFEGWYNSLSENYKSFIENPDELLKMSKKSSYLKRKKIVLQSATDYFKYIVIPSREGIALKYVNYQQIDEKNLKVNCMLDDNANFVYDFVYENESWKLDKK